MTLLKALELLKRKAHTYDDEYCFPKMDCKKELDDKTEEAYQRLLKALTELEELKRYPTSDEVCEALSEYMKAKVNYIPHRLKKNGFYLVDSGIYLVSLGYDNQVNFSYNDWMKFNKMPPHLITLIGRFYEGVGK